MTARPHPHSAFLIYDGECPFCRRYADFARLSQAFPGLELISARERRSEVEEAWRRGLDLNRQMVLHVDGAWYAGEKAIFKLAHGVRRGRLRNALVRRLFGSSRHARKLYDVLVSSRLLFLRLAGREPLSRH
jgi:predicted DCC family thiol-disulfide oxidoreductase YuxK